MILRAVLPIRTASLVLAMLFAASPSTVRGGEPLPLRSPVSATAGYPQPPDAPEAGFPGDEPPEPKACNAPSFSLDASLLNDNRRTTGLVLSEGGFTPVQQSLVSGRLKNIRCERVDLELSAWYSLHDASSFDEMRFRSRAIVEVIPNVQVYGGIAYYDNPDGLFATKSLYLIAGAEYPSVWGTTVKADYLRDVKDHGDWLTVMFLKSHELGSTRKGAIFTYKHGLGATATRKLPANSNTPSMTGVPSTFYRAILEIDDGPVTWYFEASPHVSFVGRTTGVRKKHLLVTAGVRIEVP